MLNANKPEKINAIKSLDIKTITEIVTPSKESPAQPISDAPAKFVENLSPTDYLKEQKLKTQMFQII